MRIFAPLGLAIAILACLSSPALSQVELGPEELEVVKQAIDTSCSRSQFAHVRVTRRLAGSLGSMLEVYEGLDPERSTKFRERPVRESGKRGRLSATQQRALQAARQPLPALRWMRQRVDLYYLAVSRPIFTFDRSEALVLLDYRARDFDAQHQGAEVLCHLQRTAGGWITTEQGTYVDLYRSH